MKKVIIIILFFPFFLFAQNRIVLNGNVFDMISFFPIVEANIYNFTSKKFTFSDRDGNFDIFVNKGDTIIISKPQYKQVLVEVTEEIMRKGRLEVGIYYKAIVLKEVCVYALPETYEIFKKDFINTSMSTYNKIVEGTTLSDQERSQLSQGNNGNLLDVIPGKVGQAISHPFTFFYETFSRKAKMDRLAQEVIDNQEEIDKMPFKYNRELVASLTGLSGEELLDFMVYCKFSYYDLMRWSQEFIISQVKKKFTDYEYYKALESNKHLYINTLKQSYDRKNY